MLKRILLMFALLCAGTAQAAEQYVLKFATLAPAGTSWMNILDDWAKQVAHDSGGRLVFKMYPGGVAGDEPDVLRKIRFGQLQGGAFSGHGIGLIYSPGARAGDAVPVPQRAGNRLCASAPDAGDRPGFS